MPNKILLQKYLVFILLGIIATFFAVAQDNQANDIDNTNSNESIRFESIQPILDQAIESSNIDPVKLEFNKYKQGKYWFPRETIIYYAISLGIMQHKFIFVHTLRKWNQEQLGNRPEFNFEFDTGWSDGAGHDRSYYIDSIQKNDFDAIDFMIKEGFTFDVEKNKYVARSDLWLSSDFYKILESNSTLVLRKYIENGYDVNRSVTQKYRNDYEKDFERKNFLCSALASKKYDIAKIIIEQHVDVNRPLMIKNLDTIKTMSALDILELNNTDHQAAEIKKQIIKRGGLRIIDLIKTRANSVFELAPESLITEDNVRVRETPGINGTIIGKLSKGTKIIVGSATEKKDQINKSKFYWYYISTDNGIKGWVYGEFTLIGTEQIFQ